MPVRRMIARTIEAKRLITLQQKPPEELGLRVNIRVMDVKPVQKETSHILYDVVFAMEGTKEGTPLMDARLEVDAVYQDIEEKIAEINQRWMEKGDLPPDVHYEIGNRVFTYSVLCMIPITEKLNLPPIIPIPTPIPPPQKQETK